MTTDEEARPAAKGPDHEPTTTTVTRPWDWTFCTQCHGLRYLAEMAPDRQRSSGRRAICRNCRSRYDRQQYLANRDPILAQQSQYRKENPGVGWAASYRRRARRHGFTPKAEVLTPEDLIACWGERCVYCAIGPFEQVDHIMPVAAGGHHVLNNVVPCCQKCNQWKRWASDEWLIRRYRAAAGGEHTPSTSTGLA